MTSERDARPGTAAPAHPRDPRADPLAGRVLDRRYEIIERIARGGMASVYTATDLRLDRLVAVKIMHPGLGDDREFAARFVGEARAAARLSHPHVVSVFDQGEDDGVVFLAMELVSGHTLRDTINQRAPLAPRHAVAILEPVVAALAAAHQAGLIHRDVKPENVLIADDGRVKVADFGLAKAITSTTQHTATGMLIGTVSYVAPEIVTEGRSDARGDVYAVGVILYELLTGHKPHSGETPIQIAYRHVHHDVPAPSTAVAGIPAYVDALVARATARDPHQRPADARVLKHQLAQVRLALAGGVADDPRLVADLLPRPTPVEPEPTHQVTDPHQTAPHESAPHESAPHESAPHESAPPESDWESSALEALFGSRDEPGDTRDRPVARRAPTTRTAVPPPPPRRTATPPPPPPPRRGRPADPQSTRPEAVRPARGATAAGPPPGRPRRRRRGALLLVLALLVAAAVGTGAWWFGYARYTATPALLGLSQAAAERQLDDAGLDLDVADRVYSDTVEAGAVVSTDPAPGDRALDGSTVQVTVSLGVEEYDVPVLAGLTEDAAQDAVADAHLTFGTSTPAYSETVAAGQVVSSTPRAGKTVRPGTTVDVVLSQGREPIKVGDWTDRKVDTATTKLTERGLVVDAAAGAYSDTVAEGRVISQEPEPGQVLFRGDTVTLVVSRGPELVSVPEGLIASGTEAATEALEAAGLRAQLVESDQFLGLGYVLSTSPRAGERIPKGSVVTLSII